MGVAWEWPPGRALVADGGLATALEERGHDLSGALWSARLLRDAPGEIEAVHAAYLRAGADLVTTAGYQASFEGFAAAGVDAGEAARLLRASVQVARRATAAAGRGLVAASIGPYGAALADGSEYRGRYGRSVRWLRAWHERRLEVVLSAAPDLVAVETVPDVEEAQAVVGLLAGTGVPAWLSYTVAGGRTRAGQGLVEAFQVAVGVPEIIAVGVNCCAPDEVDAALDAARRVGVPAVVYPNSGEGWDAVARWWTPPAGVGFEPARRAREWRAAGARIIGGCCRVGPADIARIAAALR